LGQAHGGVAQKLARDVNRYISRWTVERSQQDARFGDGAGAKFDQPAVRADLRRNLSRILFEDRDFGAGRIILWKAADFLQQSLATRVIEEFARDRFGGAAEPVEHSVAKAFFTGCEIMKREAGAADHPTSSASRSPAKAQRAEGGKKLR